MFIDPRYLPNRLVYRTILDVHYRDHEHPPYHKLEGHGHTYLGSMHNYSLSGLYAMADLIVEIEARVENYPLPVEFRQELEELRWEIDE